MTGVIAGAESRAPVLAGIVFAALLVGLADGAAAKPVTVADLLAVSPAGDWRVPDPEDTLYMDLERGRVVIELASRAAPQHVANIRTLARYGMTSAQLAKLHEVSVDEIDAILGGQDVR